jgi:hypothetical protein
VKRRFAKEVAAAGLRAGPGPDTGVPVTEADLAQLPAGAQRYLRFMRVVGRPRDSSFRLGWIGRFRMKPGQPWRRIKAWQYNTCVEIARIFHIRMRWGGVLPVLGRDTYLHGHGRMLIRLADAITVADARGEELDTSELVTYLNDCVLIAPSMLLRPSVSWTAVDDVAFDVSLTDAGRTVTGRVFVDERGAPRDFSTTDRFADISDDPARPFVRARWTTPIEGWNFSEERPMITSGQALWHLPDGPFAYADMRPLPGSLAFNVRPGA